LKDDVYEYYCNVVAPLVADAPEVLRLRLMEIDNAIQQRGAALEMLEKKDIHTYFVLVELEGEDCGTVNAREVDEMVREAGCRRKSMCQPNTEQS
jgi:hypothetical protein